MVVEVFQLDLTTTRREVIDNDAGMSLRKAYHSGPAYRQRSGHAAQMCIRIKRATTKQQGGGL